METVAAMMDLPRSTACSGLYSGSVPFCLSVHACKQMRELYLFPFEQSQVGRFVHTLGLATDGIN